MTRAHLRLLACAWLGGLLACPSPPGGDDAPNDAGASLGSDALDASRARMCAPASFDPLLQQGEAVALPPEMSSPVALAFSPSGAGYLLALEGLWRWDPGSTPAFTRLTDDVGALPGYQFQIALEVHDDAHVYWNQGGTIRGWEKGAIVDHFVGHDDALLDVLAVSPRELWAAGYGGALLHEVDGVVEAIDLVSTIEPRPDDAQLELWDLEPIPGGIAVVGTGSGVFGTLTGTVGVLGVMREGDWRAGAVDTRPAFGFLNFAAPTCGGEGLALGGDFALHGYVTFDHEYTHFLGGGLEHDLLISSVVETCGGITYIGTGVPSGPSLIAEIDDDPPGLSRTDDQVPGFLFDAACHDGRLYYLDAATAPPSIRRYR